MTKQERRNGDFGEEGIEHRGLENFSNVTSVLGKKNSKPTDPGCGGMLGKKDPREYPPGRKPNGIRETRRVLKKEGSVYQVRRVLRANLTGTLPPGGATKGRTSLGGACHGGNQDMNIFGAKISG